jgi:hypothetical protein
LRSQAGEDKSDAEDREGRSDADQSVHFLVRFRGACGVRGCRTWYARIVLENPHIRPL